MSGEITKFSIIEQVCKPPIIKSGKKRTDKRINNEIRKARNREASGRHRERKRAMLQAQIDTIKYLKDESDKKDKKIKTLEDLYSKKQEELKQLQKTIINNEEKINNLKEELKNRNAALKSEYYGDEFNEYYTEIYANYIPSTSSYESIENECDIFFA